MLKNKIKISSITSSPYFVASLLSLVVVLVIGVIVFFIGDIVKTKGLVIKEQQAYTENIQKIATLEELRAENKRVQEQLREYNNVLPEKSEDIYITMEALSGICNNFNLTIITFDTPEQNFTNVQETMCTFTVDGQYQDVMRFLQYITSMKAIHRADALSLQKNEKGTMTANITITILSQS